MQDPNTAERQLWLAGTKSTLFMFMADPETKSQNLFPAQNNISLLLKGDRPRRMGEWQLVPELRDGAYRFRAICLPKVLIVPVSCLKP